MELFSKVAGPIGVFDSGYGGLTVFDKILERMPAFDYIYLGDNARAPYGGRSFEVVYRFTREAVMRLFQEGCQLVILACNTASAKALRTIQQCDLPQWDASRRVLGVIRPTVELMDRPGQLVGVTSIIARMGANVISVHHDRAGKATDINACHLQVVLETRNQEHIDNILQELIKSGYHVIL